LHSSVVAKLISKLVTKTAIKKATNGELKHGLPILYLAIACLLFSLFAAWAYFFDDDVQKRTSDVIATTFLFWGFGIATLSCFAEYFKVKGSFDNVGIEFYTPWTGAKKEKWENLYHAEFNDTMHWYTIEFKSGKKVRLSGYLLGHGEVLKILKGQGYDL